MSVSTEIQRLTSAKASIKSAIEAKGVTVPSATTLDGYAALIAAIKTGSNPRMGTVLGTRTNATTISFSVQGEPIMWAVQLNRNASYISGSTTRYITSAICDGVTVYTTCLYRSGSTAQEYNYSTADFAYSNGTLTITSDSTSTVGSWYSGTSYYRLIYIY